VWAEYLLIKKGAINYCSLPLEEGIIVLFSKPPALPGDKKGNAVRAKCHSRMAKFSPCKMGMQVPCGDRPEV